MTNDIAVPTIVPATVPDDFQFKGTNAEIMRQILAVVSQSKVAGVSPSDATPFDIASVQQQVSTLQNSVDEGIRKRFTVRLNAVRGIITVPFPEDMPSADYTVQVAYLGPNGTIANYGWHIINDSKAKGQVQVRLQGDIGDYDVEVTIEEDK